MLAAGLGAVIGAAVKAAVFTRPQATQDVADLKVRKAMQQTIARLTEDIKALKASTAVGQDRSRSCRHDQR